MKSVLRGAWCVGILLIVACGDMGSGYTAEQITAIQQGTPVNAVLTAFPVKYAPTRPASVGVGGVEQPAVQAQWTVEAATRVAGEGTRVSDAATRGSGEATRASVELTQDAAAFQNELASANIQLQAEQEMTGLQVILAAKSISTTIQAMEYQAKIDAADVASAEQQLYWFEQSQRAEVEKELSQARFWEAARYVAMVGTVLLVGAGLYWWFVLRPHQQVRVVTVNGEEMAMVHTPNGYAPIVPRRRWAEPQPEPEEPDAQEPEEALTTVQPADWGLFMNWRDRTSIPLGVTTGGRPLVVNVANEPHLMIAGTTRSGKSGMGLLPYACGMSALGAQVVLVNGRGIDFMPLENRPGFTVLPRVEGPQLIQLVGEMLDALVNEMLRRDAILRQYMVHNWLQLPQQAGQPGEIMVGIDEFLHVADEANEVEPGLGHKMWFNLRRLTNEGGKYGVSVVLTVTNPTTRALGDDGMIVRAQMGRMAFRMKGAAASRTFLDVAQKELPNGTVGFPVGAFAAALDGPIRQAVSFRPSAVQVVEYLNNREFVVRDMPDVLGQVLEKGTGLLAQPRTTDLLDLMTENQAEQDAQKLLANLPSSGRWTSRAQVARHLTGTDDPSDYIRGDSALKVLIGQGVDWARKLLVTDARYAA